MKYEVDYEKRELNAARRMEQNAENENLTPAQHDVLATICRMRHELHTNKRAVFYSESSKYSELREFISEVNDMFADNGFGDLDVSIDVDDIPSDADYEFEEDYEGTYADWEEEKYTECADMIEDLNNSIERKLAEIDKETGTNYCPTGATRLL